MSLLIFHAVSVHRLKQSTRIHSLEYCHRFLLPRHLQTSLAAITLLLNEKKLTLPLHCQFDANGPGTLMVSQLASDHGVSCREQPRYVTPPQDRPRFEWLEVWALDGVMGIPGRWIKDPPSQQF